jgi:hypothetical protein
MFRRKRESNQLSHREAQIRNKKGEVIDLPFLVHLMIPDI